MGCGMRSQKLQEKCEPLKIGSTTCGVFDILTAFAGKLAAEAMRVCLPRMRASVKTVMEAKQIADVAEAACVYLERTNAAERFTMPNMVPFYA